MNKFVKLMLSAAVCMSAMAAVPALAGDAAAPAGVAPTKGWPAV